MNISFSGLRQMARCGAVVAGMVCCCLATTARAERKPQSGGVALPQVARINREIHAGWEEWKLKPSPAAAEGEWCRRVYLDVIGRTPTFEELQEFQKGKDAEKRLKLVNRLLHDEQYTEEYARNWTTIWTNVLIGRSGGTEQNSLTNREGMQKYLRDSFARNKPYDRMVRELVAAEGSTVPGNEDFNGAANFLAMKVNEEKGALATAATAKIFLGLQVQCTQCHNHPFNDWKQRKFWEMNAFFRQTRALRKNQAGTRRVESAELVDEDFAGEGSRPTPEEAEIYYELRSGELEAAYPVFVDDREISRSGYVKDVRRRQQLADLMLKPTNPEEATYVEKAIVNRIWAHFLGYGFTKPIDDMGSHNPPSHPELIDFLGLEFRENSYDLKQLITWIVLSEPYSLSSRTNDTNRTVDDPLLGEKPKFSRFYLRQMRAEELYESLLAATQAQKTRGSYEDQEKAKSQWLQQFTIAFGNDEGDEQTTFNGTIPQALTMFNGDLIKQAIGAEKGSFLWTVGSSGQKVEQKINYLFLTALARPAGKNEMAAAQELFTFHAAKKKGDAAGASVAAAQDLWWAVLNSNEFIINH